MAIPLFQKVSDIRGEADCIFFTGNIHYVCSRHSESKALFIKAIGLFKKAGNIQGEANCIRALGDLEELTGDEDPKEKWQEALSLYTLIPEPISMGKTHLKLAEITEGEERAAHKHAARELLINRPYLLEKLDREPDDPT